MNQEFQAILCPYCGHTQRKMDRCEVCGGSFDPVSRRGVAVNLGPWQLHDDRVPFRPGFHYTAMKRLIATGKVNADSIIKGPSTQQLWAPARLTPGIAHLVGRCQRCEAEVSPTATRCPQCDQGFKAETAYNELGLPFTTASEARAAQAELDLEFTRSGGKSRALKLWHHPDVPVLALCPYCGQWQKNSEQCASCGGAFDQLSQRATIIAMGPWYVRNKRFPYLPGCSYDVVRKQIEAKRIDESTIIRGPTTRQSWSVTRNIPGLSHLVGFCWSCGKAAKPTDPRCQSCNSPFGGVDAQNALGLPFASEADALAAEQKLEAQFNPMMPPTPMAAPAPLPVAAGGAMPTGLNSMGHAAVVQTAFSGLDRASLAVIAAAKVEPEVGIAPVGAAATSQRGDTVPVARPRHRMGRRQSRPMIVAALVVLIAGAAITAIVLIAGNRTPAPVDPDKKPGTVASDGKTPEPPVTPGKPPVTPSSDPAQAREQAGAAWRSVQGTSRDGQVGLMLDNIADLMAQADAMYAEGTPDKAAGTYAAALAQIEELRGKVKLRDEAAAARAAAAGLMITIDPTELPEVGKTLLEQSKMRFDEAQIHFDNGDFIQARDIWKTVETGLVTLPERSKGMALVSAAEKKYLATLDRDLDATLMNATGGDAWKDVTALVSKARTALIAEAWEDAATSYNKAAQLAPPLVRAARPLAVRYWSCQAGIIAARIWHDHADGKPLDARSRTALRPLLVRLKASIDDIDQAVMEPVTKEDLHKIILLTPATAIKTSHGIGPSQSFQLGSQITTLSRLLKSEVDLTGADLAGKIADLKTVAAEGGFNETLADLLDVLAKQVADIATPAKLAQARTTCDSLLTRLANAEQAIGMMKR